MLIFEQIYLANNTLSRFNITPVTSALINNTNWYLTLCFRFLTIVVYATTKMTAFNVQASRLSHEPKVNVLNYVRTLKAIDRIVVNTALYLHDYF